MFYSFDKSSIVTAKNEIQQFKKLVKKYISDIRYNIDISKIVFQ